MNKKIISMTLYSLLIAIIFYLVGYKTAYDRIESVAATYYPQTFYATITDIQSDTLTVKGMEINDINYRSDFTFTVRDDTRIYWRYTDITLEDLDIGDNISITFSGEVQETSPAKITVDVIQLLDDEK